MKKLNNKNLMIITPEVIKECLCESFGIDELITKSHKNNKKLSR